MTGRRVPQLFAGHPVRLFVSGGLPPISIVSFAMKNLFLPILSAAVLLSACDRTEEQASAKDTKTKTLKPLGANRSKSQAPPEEVTPSQDGEPASPAALADGSAEAVTPPSQPIAPLAQQSVPGAPGGPLTQEQRDAYRADRQARRAAQIKVDVAARFKERDADGDGLLAQSEVPERMQRGFSRADADGNGSLDATEQETLIQNMSERMAERGSRDDRRGFARRAGRGRN